MKLKNHKPPAKLRKPELMAPAGDWIMLRAAIKAGADAVYFGVENLNMRSKAKNFSIGELKQISDYCKSKKVKSYLTLNTIIFENELAEVDRIIKEAKRSKIDRIICWDLAVAELCNKNRFPFCISTQSSVSNSIAALAFKKLGAVRIVLARECSLDDIRKIKKQTDLEIEAFIHGAMCIAVSGRCFMSHHLFAQSANRGDCIQPCRREYEVYDSASGKSILLGDDYVLSPKDLCTIEFIDQLIEAGIDSFKVEGRKRAPEYVAKTVSVYRKAIDLYFKKKLTAEKKKDFLRELETVYNRGFSTGFYFGKPSSEDYAGVEGSRSTTRKVYIGKVLNYFKKPKAAHILLETGNLKVNDQILIIGETTGLIEMSLKEMFINEKKSDFAKKGDEVTFVTPELVRRNDRIYVLENTEVQ
jgi:putative protease